MELTDRSFQVKERRTMSRKMKVDKQKRGLIRNEKSRKLMARFSSFEEHHLVALDRDGLDVTANKKFFNGKFHDSLHELFGNLTPQESVIFLSIILLGKVIKWNKNDLNFLRHLIVRGEIPQAMSFGEIKATPSLIFGAQKSVNREVHHEHKRKIAAAR